jgi:glycosyltransferase involved in cell wall biosynthesis
MITFSIITITYNASKYIDRTTESVLQQTYRNIEHIIVDGASTDNTLMLEKDYMERSYSACNGHEIKITCEPDNGLYDAMNKGIKMASGDYVCFLNAGDKLHDIYTIETIVKNAELEVLLDSDLPLPAVLFGNTDIIDNEGHFLFHRRLTPPEQLTWRSFRKGMLVCHQAFYARADIAKTTPFDLKYKYSSDIDWCIRIMIEAERKGLLIKNIHAVTADYTQEGTTTTHHKESLQERYCIMKKNYGGFNTFMMHLWFVIRKFVKP